MAWINRPEMFVYTAAICNIKHINVHINAALNVIAFAVFWWLYVISF